MQCLLLGSQCAEGRRHQNTEMQVRLDRPGCFCVGVQLGAGLAGDRAASGFGKLIRVQEWSLRAGREDGFA